MSLKEHFLEKAMKGEQNFMEQIQVVTGASTTTASTISATADFRHQILYDTVNDQFFIHIGTIAETAKTFWGLLA